jgi:hypothetical protein
MRIDQLRKCAGKWALLAVAVTFAPPAWAQREYTILPAPNAVGSVPDGIFAPPASPSAEALSTIHIPENLPGKRAKPIGVETLPSRREWIILSALQHGAATFDAYTTRQSIEAGGVERDPMMRPFAHSPAMYAAIQVGPLLLDYTARRMQRSRYGFARKFWWAPQSAATALFIASGVNNLQVANHP